MAAAVDGSWWQMAVRGRWQCCQRRQKWDLAALVATVLTVAAATAAALEEMVAMAASRLPVKYKTQDVR